MGGKHWLGTLKKWDNKEVMNAPSRYLNSFIFISIPENKKENKMGIKKEVRAAGSTIPREVGAGFSSFATIVYVLAVQPAILSACGMPKEAVLTSTILCTVICTVGMALWAKLPFVLSTAMGTNAIFAFSIVLPGLATWQEALGMIFWSGIIFVVISFTPIRKKLVERIPAGIKDGLAPAIGIFLMMLGFGSSGMSMAGVVDGNFMFADLKTPIAIAGMSCLLVTVFIYFYQRTTSKKIVRVPGAVLIGIFITTVVFMACGFAPLPESVVALPPDPSPIVLQVDLVGALRPGNWIFILIFFLGDFFSMTGTSVACGKKAGLWDDERDTMPGLDQAFKVDALAMPVSALLGNSASTVFVESAAGIEAGGRTRLTALSAAGFFTLALFFSPLFLAIPAAASGVALIVVGFSMFMPVFDLDKIRQKAVGGDDRAEELPEGVVGRYSNLEKIPIIATIVLTPIINDFATALCLGLLFYAVFQVLFWVIDRFLKKPTPRSATPNVVTFALLAMAIIKMIATIQ